MLRLRRMLGRVVSQDVALRNAAAAASRLRERRRAHDDVEAFLTRRAQNNRISHNRISDDRISGRATGT